MEVLAVHTVNCTSPHALRPLTICRWCYHPPFTAECSSPQNAYFFASLRWLTLQIGAAILGCTRNAAPRLITPETHRHDGTDRLSKVALWPFLITGVSPSDGWTGPA
jgi:hypothetical protein